MEVLTSEQESTGDVSFRMSDDDDTSGLHDLLDCLLNQVLNSRVHVPLAENTHSSYVVDRLMSKFYTLAIENNEYFPNQKFSSKKLPVHLCSKFNDQCQNGLDISSIIDECLNRHLNGSPCIDEEDEFDGIRTYSQIDTTTSRFGVRLIESDIQIDVLLLSKCCMQKFKTENQNSIFLINDRQFLKSKVNLTYEIVERWQIKMRTESQTNQCENAKNLLNINNLFQAIRSYLHFSQLSSWINQTKSDTVQQFPKNIAFSISYSNFVDTDFLESNYDKQSFPIVNLQFLNNHTHTTSNSTNSSKKFPNLLSTRLQMDLYSLKRNFIYSNLLTNTTGIPQLTCLINHTNHLHIQTTTQPIPIDISCNKKPDLVLEPKSPDSSSSSTTNSIVITTPTTFPNMPIYFDSNNNNMVMNEQILQSTSPKVLISSFQLTVDTTNTGEFDDVGASPVLSKSFNRRLQINSSPAPVRKGSCFSYDGSLNDPKSISNALTKQEDVVDEKEIKSKSKKTKNLGSSSRLGYSSLNLTKYRPNNLLGNFEECLLNGRLTPVGIVDGFYAEIGASGSFFPEHKILPVDASFYQVSDDIAASPYLGVINLNQLSDRGYRIPNKGTIQVTLFNPNKTVVKMFVVMYDLSDMPCNYRTFLRQRTVYVPCGNPDDSKLKSYLRYLIHLRFSTSKTGKMYLHSNIKLIFARNKSEIDPRMGGRYEYKTFTEAPKNPKYSPKK